MTAIADEKEIKKQGGNSDVPKKNAALNAANNRYLLIIILLILAQFVQTWVSASNFKKAQNNKEIVYVKLYPDGTSDVSEFKPEDEQLYFRSTIDAALERFAKARYGQQPETIRRNYGEAGVFMSDALMNDFVSTQPGGFNASQKAVDIAADKNSDRIEVKWGFADHYDRIPAVFEKKAGEVIRSNVYLTITTRNAGGIIKDTPVKKILRVQWRLLPKKALSEKKMDWLRINPIGLELVEYDLIDDPAGYNSAEVKAQ